MSKNPSPSATTVEPISSTASSTIVPSPATSLSLHRLRKRDEHRGIYFREHGEGPFDCWRCMQPVELDVVVVHHVDHNHQNNDIENLVAAHPGCHLNHHQSEAKRGKPSPVKGRPRGPMPQETKDKLSAAHKGQSGTYFVTGERRQEEARRGWRTRYERYNITPRPKRSETCPWCDKTEEHNRRVCHAQAMNRRKART